MQTIESVSVCRAARVFTSLITSPTLQPAYLAALLPPMQTHFCSNVLQTVQQVTSHILQRVLAFNFVLLVTLQTVLQVHANSNAGTAIISTLITSLVLVPTIAPICSFLTSPLVYTMELASYFVHLDTSQIPLQ